MMRMYSHVDECDDGGGNEVVVMTNVWRRGDEDENDDDDDNGAMLTVMIVSPMTVRIDDANRMGFLTSLSNTLLAMVKTHDHHPCLIPSGDMMIP